jgi:hypothetical protein
MPAGLEFERHCHTYHKRGKVVSVPVAHSSSQQASDGKFWKFDTIEASKQQWSHRLTLQSILLNKHRIPALVIP